MVSPWFLSSVKRLCWRTFYYISPGIASTNGLGLEPIRTQSHEPGSQAHRHPDRKRQLLGPQRGCLGAMLHLFVRHLFEDGTAARICLAQAFQMAAQMRFHLPLRFRDETQPGAAPQCARESADRKRAGIPQRVQDA